jgi:hypothetical protein
MNGDKVKLTVVPSGGNSAKVSADDFLRQTEALVGALKAIAASTGKESAKDIRYRIDHLSANSPATISLFGEDFTFSDPFDFSGAHRLFKSALKAIAKATEIPAGITAAVLKHIRDLCVPIGGSVSTDEIEIDGETIVLDLAFRANVAKIQDLDRVERGMFIKGFVETMNIHDSNKTFFVYPVIGPEKVKCIFRQDLRDKAKDAFGKFVMVHGDFKYEWREKHPYEIAVTEIEFIEEAVGFDGRALRGAAPDATGDLSAEEFIHRKRHG